jgi:hypothetical protein
MQALRPAPALSGQYPHSTVYAGAAPCTRVRGQPLTTPLGPFHFPTPLEIQIFFGAEVPPIMPSPRYSGAEIAPDRIQKAASPHPLKFRYFSVPKFRLSCLRLATAVRR